MGALVRISIHQSYYLRSYKGKQADHKHYAKREPLEVHLGMEQFVHYMTQVSSLAIFNF